MWPWPSETYRKKRKGFGGKDLEKRKVYKPGMKE